MLGGIIGITVLLLHIQGADRHESLATQAAKADGTAKLQRVMQKLLHAKQNDWPEVQADLSSTNPRVRYYAVVCATEAIKTPAALNATISKINDEDPEVRGLAVYELGELKYQPAFDELCALLKSGKLFSGSAIRALGKLKNPKAVPLLVTRLQSTDSIGQINSLLVALKQIGVTDPWYRSLIKHEMWDRRAALKQIDVNANDLFRQWK